MDLSWFNGLDASLQALLLGSGGSLIGGIGTNVTSALFEACTRKVRKKYAGDSTRKALNLAVAEALHIAARDVVSISEQDEHFPEKNGRWSGARDVVSDSDKVEHVLKILELCGEYSI